MNLGRVIKFDEKSKNFPITAKLTSETLRNRWWRCTPRLDQAQEGACVGFSMAYELASKPNVVRGVKDAHGFAIYHLAKVRDEWAGEDYDGTSLLAGAKVLREFNFIDEYRWAFGIDDVLKTLANYGPVVAGTYWYNDMYTPDAKGFIRPTGSIVGGHAYLIRGVNVRKEYVTVRNSWGMDWGLKGDCKISFTDLVVLLKKEGEACVPVVRKDTKITNLPLPG